MLSTLRKNAESCNTGYIRLKDLPIGRYEIQKFSLRDSKYGSGKSLIIDIPKKGYLYLPEKMLAGLNTEVAIAKLNKDRYDFIFHGENKNPPFNLLFTFEMHNENDIEDTTDDDDGAVGKTKVKPRKRSRNLDEIDFIDSARGSSVQSDASQLSNASKKKNHQTIKDQKAKVRNNHQMSTTIFRKYFSVIFVLSFHFVKCILCVYK